MKLSLLRPVLAYDIFYQRAWLLAALTTASAATTTQAAPAKTSKGGAVKRPATTARVVKMALPHLSMVRFDLRGSSIAKARDADSSVEVQRAAVLRNAALLRQRGVAHTSLPDLDVTPRPLSAAVISGSSSAHSLPATTAKVESDAGKAKNQSIAPSVGPVAPRMAATPSFLNPRRSTENKSRESLSSPLDKDRKPVLPSVSDSKRADRRALSSRSMRDRVLLARLEADLVRARHRLDGASSDLSESERDLARFTNTLRQAMLEAGSDAHGLHPFVKVAQRYAGTPYVWGGESARGFDCSGFIIRVMRDLGYRALPHSAAEQFTYGKPIAEALLKPGDLVFFANTYKPGISHVGIWLGHGRFIHAAGTGKGTIVSYLSASPYRQKYAGARRLIKGG